MNRIDTTLQQMQRAGRTALIPFVTCGDPSLDATVPVMHALVGAGASVIELGVPFSDPQADGPVIQRSSERALERKVGLRAVLDCCRRFRLDDATTPIVLMGYLNPVEIRGVQRFADEAADAGVDGVLLVDCPPEEAGPLRAALARVGMHLILLAAPTSDPERVAEIARQSQGYLYYVSFAGVTGAARLDPAAVRAKVGALREQTSVPVAVGFGVRDAESACRIGEFADAVVIGSALVEQLADAADPADAAQRAHRFLAPIRTALDAGRG